MVIPFFSKETSPILLFISSHRRLFFIGHKGWQINGDHSRDISHLESEKWNRTCGFSLMIWLNGNFGYEHNWRYIDMRKMIIENRIRGEIEIFQNFVLILFETSFGELIFLNDKYLNLTFISV